MSNTLALDSTTADLLKNHEGKTDMKFVNFTDAKNRKLSLTLDCEALGNILVSDYGQSVLCAIMAEDQKETILNLEDEIEKHTPEEFTFRAFMRDDRFFLKLPVKDGGYKAVTVPHQNPDEPEKSAFVNGINVIVEGKPGAYFNLKDKTSGLYFQATKITIGKPKTRRR